MRDLLKRNSPGTCRQTRLPKSSRRHPENRRRPENRPGLRYRREHRVYSGLCLWSRASANRIIQVDCSTLVLKNFTDEQLDEYLATDLWVGKAGSLGFQDGPPWLTLLKGSPTNVVGLPMEHLSQQLKNF